jgi:hypothetical protein
MNRRQFLRPATVALPGSSGAPPGFLMYLQAETNEGRLAAG